LKATGNNKECQGTPVLKQRADCSLGMLGGRALKDWVLEPAKGSKRKDVFTIRAQSPAGSACRKKVYIGVPDSNCKGRKLQMYAKDDHSGKQHWLMVPRGPLPAPKPKPIKKKPKKSSGKKYIVRVDAKTKGASCQAWVSQAKKSYEKIATQTANVSPKKVSSVCQIYIPDPNSNRKLLAANQDLRISLFVKTSVTRGYAL